MTFNPSYNLIPEIDTCNVGGRELELNISNNMIHHINWCDIDDREMDMNNARAYIDISNNPLPCDCNTGRIKHNLMTKQKISQNNLGVVFYDLEMQVRNRI